MGGDLRAVTMDLPVTMVVVATPYRDGGLEVEVMGAVRIGGRRRYHVL